jgi:hypothetical protein
LLNVPESEIESDESQPSHEMNDTDTNVDEVNSIETDKEGMINSNGSK